MLEITRLWCNAAIYYSLTHAGCKVERKEKSWRKIKLISLTLVQFRLWSTVLLLSTVRCDKNIVFLL